MIRMKDDERDFRTALLDGESPQSAGARLNINPDRLRYLQGVIESSGQGGRRDRMKDDERELRLAMLDGKPLEASAKRLKIGPDRLNYLRARIGTTPVSESRINRLSDFNRLADSIREAAQKAFPAVRSKNELEQARIKFVGVKTSQIRVLQAELGRLSDQDKQAAGRTFAEVKSRLEQAFEAAKGRIMTPCQSSAPS